MAAYRARKDNPRTSVKSKYHIMGFIPSGTYGRVYKAHAGGKFYAIKKFKPEKEGEILTYTGISQSAIREIAVRTGPNDKRIKDCTNSLWQLNREIRHENIVALRESARLFWKTSQFIWSSNMQITISGAYIKRLVVILMS